jgi:glycosidase/PKD repeat protein
MKKTPLRLSFLFLSVFAAAGVFAAILPLPAGTRDGINYLAGNTSVTLVLHAPGKTRAFVIGEFNNWAQTTSTQMHQTPDRQKFWLTITNLTPGVEYSFQYVVDNIRIADPYSEKILDASNDPSINDVSGFVVYPNLKAYPTGKTTGYVSVLQTAKPVFNWTVNNFNRPDQRKLLVYELLVRDFVSTHSWKTLKDTLNYLQKLGINAIELMPFNEFEANNSWGYNPNFYTAPDKYYGTDTDLKLFIDECHKRGIAVIQDIVFNHAWGSSPLAQLYWNASLNRPASNNPWFNQTAPHPFGFGCDFNFSSTATRSYFQRVLEFWLTQYKIDGFRFDLSKGFTNKFTGSDVGAWGAYDPERVANIKWLADQVWNVNSGAYVILEHLGDLSEENEFANYRQGMMSWQRLDIRFNEATMGWSDLCKQDISEVYYRHNNYFSKPLRMGNLESHDEERLMYKNNNFGNASGTYNVRNLATGLSRVQAAAAFHVLLPGPKMIWQFTELGYDFSINACTNGTLGVGDACRTARKPIRWDYFQQTDRRRLYTVMSGLMKLKNRFSNVFLTDLNNGYDMGCSTFKFYQISNTELNATVIGNFDVVPQTRTITLQAPGTWTDYITGNSYAYTTAAQTITLQPGEYRVLLNRNITMSNIDNLSTVRNFSVYFKKPAAWPTARIHYWNAFPESAAPATVWPGNAMVQECGDWYRWDFTNLNSINFVFTDGTNKTVDLSASGTSYYDNGWLTSVPVINRNTTASFTATPTSGRAPLSVSVNASASSACSGIAAYNWNFGNGTTATGALASAQYTTAGTYTIKLVITDNQSRRDSTTQSITVTNPTAPITVYVKKPADWAAPVKIHYWNTQPSGALAATTWPGVNMTYDCNDWYRFSFPSNVTASDMVFNDGTGKKTADLLNVTTSRYYDNGWLSAEPAGRCVLASQITLHFKRPSTWTNIPYVYYWNTNPALPSIAWPGFAMTDEGNGWWGYTIKGAGCGNIIFNNNASPQTADLLNVCGEKWYDNGFVNAPVARRPAATTSTDPSIRVYPNPAFSVAYIDLSLSTSGRFSAVLYDASGKVARRIGQRRLPAGSQRIELKREGLARGMYVLETTVNETTVRNTLYFE